MACIGMVGATTGSSVAIFAAEGLLAFLVERFDEVHRQCHTLLVGIIQRRVYVVWFRHLGRFVCYICVLLLGSETKISLVSGDGPGIEINVKWNTGEKKEERKEVQVQYQANHSTVYDSSKKRRLDG